MSERLLLSLGFGVLEESEHEKAKPCRRARLV